MLSLVDILSKTPRGRIFLINLYEGLTATPAHLCGPDFKAEVWDPVRRSLPATVTRRQARQAHKSLIDFLHDPANRWLRFRRNPAPSTGKTYVVQTTTQVKDVLHDTAKAVLDDYLVMTGLNRDDENAPLKDHHLRKIVDRLKKSTYWNGRDYAQTYDMFWATFEPSSWTFEADRLRDAQGLVHINEHVPVIQLRFNCTNGGLGCPGRPAKCVWPTAVEATDHRRFKARSRRGEAHAVDLDDLRRRRLNDGVGEVVLSAVPMNQLADARFVGITRNHADISAGQRSSSMDDRAYARELDPNCGLPAAITYLKNVLEPTVPPATIAASVVAGAHSPMGGLRRS